ncbi:hypothetical protein GGG16DRAFT_123712 [Schizophyllum commune]
MSTRGTTDAPRGVNRGRVGRGGVKRGRVRGGAGRGAVGGTGATGEEASGAGAGRGASVRGRGVGRGRGAGKRAANKIGGNQQKPTTKEVHANGQRLIKIVDIALVYHTSVDIPTIPIFKRTGLKSASPATLITPGQLKAARKRLQEDVEKRDTEAGPSKPEVPIDPSDVSDPSDPSDDSDDPDHWNSNYGPDGPYWGGDYSDDDLRGLVDEIGSGFGCTAPGMAYKHWDD